MQRKINHDYVLIQSYVYIHYYIHTKQLKHPKKNQDIKVIKSFTVPNTDQYYGVLFGNKWCNVFENNRFVCSQKH